MQIRRHVTDEGVTAIINPHARDFDEQIQRALRHDVEAIRFTDVAPQAAIETVTKAGIRIVS